MNASFKCFLPISVEKNSRISHESCLKLSFIARQLKAVQNSSSKLIIERNEIKLAAKDKTPLEIQQKKAAEYFGRQLAREITIQSALDSVNIEIKNKILQNPENRLGQRIGTGAEADIYSDSANPLRLIKKYKACVKGDDCLSQVAAFNKYYGSDSASLQVHSGKYYMEMPMLPGIPLLELSRDSLPIDADEKFLAMLERMHEKNLFHIDLNEGNILYDAESRDFYPIDIAMTEYSSTALADYARAVTYIRQYMAAKIKQEDKFHA